MIIILFYFFKWPQSKLFPWWSSIGVSYKLHTNFIWCMITLRDVSDGGDIVIDHTKGESVTRVEEGEVEVQEVRAHCVIIAARCDWFRRALLSGMKESIHKYVLYTENILFSFYYILTFVYSPPPPFLSKCTNS